MGKQLLVKLLELYGDSNIVTRVHEANVRSRKLLELHRFTWTHQQHDERGTWNWFKRPGSTQQSRSAVS